MIKKISYVLIVILIMLCCVSGCYLEKEDNGNYTLKSGNKYAVKEVHSKEDLIYVLDNLNCSNKIDTTQDRKTRAKYSNLTTSKKEDNCGIKNNYNITNENFYVDDNGNNARILTVHLNDYDLDFNISSTYYCTGGEFSASCLQYSYGIRTDLFVEISRYYREQYKLLNQSEVCDISKLDKCKLSSYNDISEVAKYIDGFKDFLNNSKISFKPLKDVLISIDIPSYNNIRFYIRWQNNIFVIQEYSSNQTINDIEKYISDYCEEHNVFEN